MTEFNKTTTNTSDKKNPKINRPDKQNCKTYASNKNPYSVYRPDDEYKAREGYDKSENTEDDFFEKKKTSKPYGAKSYENTRAKRDGYKPYLR